VSTVLADRDRNVVIVTINRPDVRNAVDAATAEALLAAFRDFDRDDGASVAVLTGAEGTFCAGADLKAVAAGEQRQLTEDAPAPLGPTRLLLGKPVLAAVEGHAVAGGLELALWCDLRVAAHDAVFGVFCRRFGVPLLDLGTVRLPRLVGHSHAMDLILTGRGIQGEEALRMGLVNRLVPKGQALDAAVRLAHELAQFPPALPAVGSAVRLRAVVAVLPGGPPERAPSRAGATWPRPAWRFLTGGRPCSQS
jgi:enoyl-CoA hydratase